VASYIENSTPLIVGCKSLTSPASRGPITPSLFRSGQRAATAFRPPRKSNRSAGDAIDRAAAIISLSSHGSCQRLTKNGMAVLQYQHRSRCKPTLQFLRLFPGLCSEFESVVGVPSNQPHLAGLTEQSSSPSTALLPCQMTITPMICPQGEKDVSRDWCSPRQAMMGAVHENTVSTRLPHDRAWEVRWLVLLCILYRYHTTSHTA
jgi:hypothetical protein